MEGDCRGNARGRERGVLQHAFSLGDHMAHMLEEC
jgi:hypothetical protein